MSENKPIISGIFERRVELDADKKLKDREDFYVIVHRRLFTNGRIKELHGARLHVLLALMLHADAKGEAFPSQATIASETGYRIRAVNTALQGLRAAGFITYEREHRADGTFAKHATYKLVLGASEAGSAPDCQKDNQAPECRKGNMQKDNERITPSEEVTPDTSTEGTSSNVKGLPAAGLNVAGVNIPAALLARLDDEGEGLTDAMAVEASGVHRKGRGNDLARFKGFVADVALAAEADPVAGRVVQLSLDDTAKNIARCRGNVIDYFAGVLVRKAIRAEAFDLLKWLDADARAREWKRTVIKTSKALALIAEKRRLAEKGKAKPMSEADLVAERQRIEDLVVKARAQHYRDSGQQAEHQEYIDRLERKLTVLGAPPRAQIIPSARAMT